MDKILSIQKKIGKLVKDQTNPYFQSKYFDVNQVIEQLMPLLEEFSLTVIQPLTSTPDNSPALATIVMDGDKKVVHSVVPLPKIDDPQKMGSAITYYRRYSLQSLFLLQAEDDDSNHASNKYKAPTKAERESYNEKNKKDKEEGKDPLTDDEI